MNRFGNNIASNIIAKLWSLVSVYIFIPFYIKILGETSYGLVSFFATLQMALQLLGLGLSNTLRREFALADRGEESRQKKYLLLRSIENIYFVIGIIIILICALGSDFIANQWLNIENLNSKNVSHVIGLMGCSIAFQMIANLYAGCLFGLDNQVLANICTVTWSALKSIGALALIYFLAPDLILFYSWHIVVDIVYLIVLRILVCKKLDLSVLPRWSIKNFSNMRSIWRYAFGILFISLIALINKQLDKVIISKFLTLTELGAYNVATTLGGATEIMPSALYTSVFPRFTKNATSGNNEQLKSNFLTINKVVNIFLSCSGAFIAIYALPLIELWTGSSNYASILGPVGAFVVLSVTNIQFQQIPYALALAHGNTRINVFVGGIFIPIVSVSTYFSIMYYGLKGAGVVYLVMMVLQTLLYEFLIYKKYISSNPIKLIFYDTILPMVIALILASISKIGIQSLTSSTVIISSFAVFVGAISAILFYLVLARKEIKEFIHMRGDK